MEQWRILLDQEVSDVARAVLGRGRRVGGVLGRIDEANLVAMTVDERWQQSLLRARQAQVQLLDVATDALQRGHAARSSERARIEAQREAGEEARRSLRREVMTDESQLGEVSLVEVVEESVAS